MRQSGIERVAYRPPAGSEDGVEVRTVADLLEHAGAETFRGTQRLDFHLLLVVTDGRARHTVDFADRDLRARTVLWVRPGQVHRWGDLAAFSARVVIFPPGLIDPATDALAEVDRAYGPFLWHLGGSAWDDVLALVTILQRAHDRSVTDTAAEIRRAGSRHALAATLLRLADASGETGTVAELPAAFVAFRDAVERDFSTDRHVSSYASRLGYSTRTLSRATKVAAGITPKTFLDARVLLEAKRLLAHSALTVSRVGATVGFDDTSNFSAWFAARAGVTPSAFRTRIAG